tara:strand:+ start:1258 stop:2073 length:816 start_codon:yes stop_codon:yes gene_type:complete
MVKKNMLISILINNYNNQKYIKKSIYSCLNQTYKNLEIIIFDDNSTDNSKKIIKNIRNKKLIKIFQSKKKQGLSISLNQLNAIKKSFSKSKGNIIFLLDGDDYFLKNKVKFILNLFQKDKKLNFVQDNPIYFYPKNNLKIVKKPKKKHFPMHTWPYINPTSTMVFKRSFLKKLLKEISFSNNDFKRISFDARAFIYIHFFEKNYLCIRKSLTMYTQNIYGYTIKNYKNKNLNWWARRFEQHSYVKKLFQKKNKFHFRFIDYYLTYLIKVLF